MCAAAQLTFAEAKKKKNKKNTKVRKRQERFQLNLSRAHGRSCLWFPWIHRSLVLT